MGWTGEIRPKGQTWRAFFGARLDAGHAIVACNTARDLAARTATREVFYAAVRDNTTGVVTPWIVLLDHSRRAEYTGYVYWKGVSETAADRGERGDICASAAVLDALTPTEDPDAIDWRRAARRRLEQQAAHPPIGPGVTFRFPELDLRFSDGKSRDTFTVVKGNEVNTLDGFRVTLPAGWRDWPRELVTVAA